MKMWECDILGSENIIFPQLPSTRDGNEKSNGEIFETSNVS